jgi:hypothetical protein
MSRGVVVLNWRYKMENFKECRTVEEANKVDLDKYTFVRATEDGRYIFKIRERKR